MANVIINDSYLTDIADAIRGKNGTADTYAPNEMAAAITSLSSGGGQLAYALLTYSSTNSTYGYKTFDISNYLTSGTIYFITTQGSSTYACIITDGEIISVTYSSNGSLFRYTHNESLSFPHFKLEGTDMLVYGSSSNQVQNNANVVYVA